MLNGILAFIGRPDWPIRDFSLPLYVFVVLLMGCSYPLLIYFSAWMLGKWLRLKVVSPMSFLCLMYNALVIFQFRDLGDVDAAGAGWIGPMADTISIILAFILLFVFYFLDARALSGLSLDDAEIDWKVFNIPPTIFISLYMAALLPVMYCNDTILMAMFSLFAIVVVFLLIWAFNVIIKNIKATHEAVTAKDEALKAKDEVKTLSVEVMEALAHTIDAKDEYTRGHSVRVAKYSRMLAEKLGLSQEERENVYYMALLHDIGKIGVPNAIINSPTRLTDEEYAVIKTHPGVGFDILAEIKSRPDLTIGARWHHERYDGKGYPDGKAGTDIPFYARIIAVADTYDAMTSNRSYRKYMAQEAVRAEMEKNSGTQFDPDVVKCMLEIIDEDKNYELHE